MVEIVTPNLKRLLNDWESWRHGKKFPSRADFDPVNLKYILGHLSLIDVTYDPLQFHYRVYGSFLTQRIGKEMTHKSVDDLPGEGNAERIKAHLSQVIQDRIPMAFLRLHRFQDSDLPRNSESLMLPLSNDGEVINMIMTGVVWDMEEPDLSPFDHASRIDRFGEWQPDTRLDLKAYLSNKISN